MPEKLKGFKSRLPTKICRECGRLFQYRKKWKEVWPSVEYCSKRCRYQAKHKKTGLEKDRDM